MEYTELIQKRYSVRAYRSTPVEEEKLLEVLDAARLAPTAANRQSFSSSCSIPRGARKS